MYVNLKVLYTRNLNMDETFTYSMSDPDLGKFHSLKQLNAKLQLTQYTIHYASLSFFKSFILPIFVVLKLMSNTY